MRKRRENNRGKWGEKQEKGEETKYESNDEKHEEKCSEKHERNKWRERQR